jgi:2-polyprenyl-6-methoxyphenol hydroxylase-like FAD-dependent oxidoreductase
MDSDRVVGRTLPADLVVDATGRSSAAPKWLCELGYEKPDETIVDAHLGYSSRLYQVPDSSKADWVCAIVQRAPPDRKRGGLIFLVEGNRWLVTLIGGGHDSPPADEEGFLEYTRSLRTPIIYDAIKGAEPASSIKTHRATQNRMRHFERAKRFPHNFLLLGDAVCAFNPVYGQGMTVAAMGVMELDKILRERRDKGFEGLSLKFQKRLAKLNKAPWMMATNEDFRYRETVGGCPSVTTKFMHMYMDQVMRLSTESSDVRNVLLHVFSMLIPPTALFRPAILGRVLKQLTNLPKGAPMVKEKRTGTRARLLDRSIN